MNKDPSAPQESNVTSADMVGLALSDTSHSDKSMQVAAVVNWVCEVSEWCGKIYLFIDY